MKTRQHHKTVNNKTMKKMKKVSRKKKSKETSSRYDIDAAIKKHNIKPGANKKLTKAEALIRLNSGMHGINWKDKARTFNYPEELVVANVMQGHAPFKHHVEYKERHPSHKFRL